MSPPRRRESQNARYRRGVSYSDGNQGEFGSRNEGPGQHQGSQAGLGRSAAVPVGAVALGVREALKSEEKSLREGSGRQVEALQRSGRASPQAASGWALKQNLSAQGRSLSAPVPGRTNHGTASHVSVGEGRSISSLESAAVPLVASAERRELDLVALARRCSNRGRTRRSQ